MIRLKSNPCCPQFIADILAQCHANPERICVCDDEGREYTYGDFLETIEKTSGYIRRLGIVPKSFIVINLPNSMEYLAIEYGIWLAGCAICPVNPLYPQARIDFITVHCDAALTIDEAVLDEIRQTERLSICECTADIAALFYTSGSTGTPKAVIHTFETLSHCTYINEIAAGERDGCFALGSPLSFVAFMPVIEYFRRGGRLMLLSRKTMTDSALLQKCLNEGGATGTFINPSALKQLDLSANTTLKYVLTGSERVIGLRSQGNYRLICTYGMTETAGICFQFDIDKPYDNTPIGKPTSDIEVKIAADGEICLRGHVTPGYYKDAEHSAQSWRDGWFHTGDIGRRLPDGNIVYLNRKDWMVKINGQRVEMGEIIHHIGKMPGVKDAVAKGFTAADGHQYIVGYYVADESVTDETLKDFLKRNLVSYMVPSILVRMNRLPRNVNGKLDMNSLQSPLESNSGRKITAPTTEIQKQLCSAFESALGISPVGIEDDFFCLGGDSIRVMQVQAQCPEFKLSTDIIYEGRTVKAIAAALEAGMQEKATTHCKKVEDYPLSTTQQGIFVECIKRDGEAAYNNPFLIRLDGAVDAARLATACEQAVKAHSNLFTTIFTDNDGRPRQKMTPTELFHVEVETLSDIAFESLRHNLMQPFNILKDRLFRMKIYRTDSSIWLFADFHHIVFDGSSNVVLMEDIEKAYRAEEVENERCSGFDLALEEYEKRGTPLLADCRKWNLDTFGETDNTTLPSPDKFVETVAYGKFERDSCISADAFFKAAHNLGVTENILALGAFGYMLGVCSHGTKSAFATVYNGRKSLDTSRTVSMMVKTLPVTCNWDGNTTIGDYLQNLKFQLAGSMSHDLYSFAELCHDTAFDSRVLFTWQDELLERKTFCGVPCNMESLLDNATGEPFAVQLYKKNGALSIRTEYRSNMYSEEYISRYIDCFEAILNYLLVAGKDEMTTEIRLVDEYEEKELIRVGTGEKLQFDTEQTFTDLFGQCVEKYPDSTAVVDENESVSYSSLNAYSDRIASCLSQAGVQKEDFVGIMLPRLWLYPASYIACFKCGAAFVPMDSEYPIDRLQYMIDDSEAKVLLTTRAIYDQKCAEGRLNVAKVIFAEDLPQNLPANGIPPVADAGCLAYMIYTSGTTGKPKGVMIEHHCLMNMVQWARHYLHLCHGIKVAQHASFSFDGSLIDLMATLCFGGELHILASSLRKDLGGMYRYFGENRIDGITFTTQLGLTMLKMYDLKLKYMMLGGEKMTPPEKTSVRVINGYGPTEFTVASSLYEIDPENIPDNIPIGKAVPNTVSAIVDAFGRLLPRGVEGELVLIGPQLSRGYWHRPDITDERFAPCSFLPGQKMYHTGDLARWNDDGNLLYLGRLDTQVKLRGFRIELGEIESTLLKFEGIRQGVVNVKEISGLQHLCAYYCADKQIDTEKLRAFLAESLTDYMVPTAYMQMDQMPYTPNGKVDLRRLPIPEIKAEEIVEPATELEATVLDITKNFLGTSEFGVTTNLISMGMTSLGAISLSLLIEKKTGQKISSALMLKKPTVREWAYSLAEDEASRQKDTVQPYELRELYPLTDNQTGIYINWEQHRDGTEYNVPMVFSFDGIDAEELACAAKTFVDAHPHLKTIFRTVEGQTYQVRNDKAAIKVNVTKLSSKPTKEFFQSRVRPFDLFKGPLCRIEAFAFENSSYLMIDVHHIIFDGASESLFAKELLQVLNGGSIENESFTAFDYSLYYDRWKQSEEFGKAGQYYAALLDGAVSVRVPSSGESEGSGAGRICVSVDRSAVRKCCRAAGITENAFFLTAVTEVLHRLTREEKIAILTVSNGRSLSALEHSTGMFVQTLPVTGNMTSRTVGEALSAMHRQVVETVSCDKYPFAKIVETCGIKTNFLVAYQGDVLNTDLNVRGKEVGLTSLAPGGAKMPVSLNIVPGRDLTSLEFEYDRSQYCEKDIRIFSEAVKSFAENLSRASMEALTGSISCLDSAQTADVISTGSGVKMEVPADATMVRFFREAAAKYPGHTAVVDESSSMTYAELDRKSDALAAYLLSKGVKKEDFIALMMPRLKEYPVSYLAVFKSGCAFVPMDYEYPPERIQYMIEDSHANVLITTRKVYSPMENKIKVGNVIFLDELDLDAIPSTPIDRTSPEGLAYMIYTSGTTGKPKGVMIEHRGLANLVCWKKDAEKIGPGTRSAEHASFSFDASIIELMTSLSFGGELHILGESIRKDPEKMRDYINGKGIDTLIVSTQLGCLLLNSYDLKLKYIGMGGEKLSGSFPSGITVSNEYGPTEFTVCSSYYTIDNENPRENIPIGRAVPNTISAIVDPCGQLLPQGAEGELVLIGPQIARGYFGKEEMTRKRFADCPFVPGSKMYHTGDLVRWSEDGQLLYSGRIDTQVKLRGFRIELGEIESTVKRIKGITSAVAAVKEIDGTQHLCAYFTAPTKIDADAVRKEISSSLTSYMVPDAIMQLESLPLTPNGKVDSKALPVPELGGGSTNSFEEPVGERETLIAKIFAEVLGTSKPVGRNDSFFRIGGTSLLVMKVIVMLSDNGLNTTYGDVFKYPSPSTLAAFLDGMEAAAPAGKAESTQQKAEAVKTVGEDGYDYSIINKTLATNTVSSIGELDSLSNHSLGDVLLLGATGYLGIHILNEFLEQHKGKIHLVIRPKKGISSEGRLKSYLMYYFDRTFAELIGKRIFIVEGDMTDDAVMAKLLEIKVDTVINCAANVKHFAAGDEIEKINLHGTEILIGYCLKTGARLVHTSTHSISGQMEGADAHIMTESELYFGQKLMTKYQTSKFAAERAILEAVATKGLKAKIMRLGNLMPRYSDGEFQINMENNGFMARMRAYYLIGCIAQSHLHSSLEFAPIDQTASAVLTLATTPDKFTVFHPFNNHTIFIDDVVAIMRKCGLPVRIASDNEFSARLNSALEDDRLNPFITTLLAYAGHNNYVMNSPSLEFTVSVLNAMDWRWSITGERYLSDAFNKLIGLEYFDK